jgi:hypothetical protein
MEIICNLLTFKKEINQKLFHPIKKESNKLIQGMEVEIPKKGNCIRQYKTLAEKEHINVLNILCNSKKAFSLLRKCHVCHLVCITLSVEQKHGV